jgi:hypothetical protein
MKMAETKYGHLVKAIPEFKDYGYGNLRQVTEMDADFLGYELNISYGTYYTAGPIESHETQVCDYDQVQLFIGADTYDLGYLGAQIDYCLGEEKEKYRITTSTAVRIPKGVPFGPARIGPMDDNFIRMTIAVTSKVGGKVVAQDTPEGPYAAGFGGKYARYIGHGLAFTRNGPWHYGPNNPDTHDGAITDINGIDFEFNMSYESINRAPYRFSPVPDKPHVHPYTEFLVFMGCDCDDLSYFPAEVELCMGEEMEVHEITQPTIAIQPKGHPHIPLRVLRQDEPWIFMVLRPWGHGPQVPPPGGQPPA